MKSGYNGEATTSKKFTFLQRMDMFGVGININYNKETKFRTRFGGFITLIVGILLAILIFSSLQQIIYKTSPKVLSEQKIVRNPSRYDLNKKNFSIAFAVIQGASKVLYDETIFRIEATFSFKEQPINPDGSKGTIVITQKQIELEKCNEQSFQVDGTQDYFLSLQYQNMYCMKNYDDLYLVGQYEMDEYSIIQFKVIPCSSKDPKNKVKCMDSQKQTEILKKTSLQIFYSNNIFQVSNNEQPFQPMGQTQFWKTNIDFLQTIQLQYMNTFVEDDEGLFFKDTKTTKSLLLSTDRYMFSSIDDFSIFKVGIFLEKNKELYYSRQYLKIQNIISEIGGIYNVLLIIGILIAQPYSKMQLHRKLFNQTFSIAIKQQNSNQNQENNNNNSDEKVEKSQENQQNNDKSDLKSPQSVQSPQTELKQGQIEMSKLKEPDEIENNQQSQNRNDRITAFSKYIEPDLKDTIKSTLTQLTIKTSEIISYYFNCFKILKSDMIDMLDFGSQHINNFTDICFIVNKLLEVEKLKHVLLNDEQIKLFEFIPKPKIDSEIIQMNQIQILNEQKKSLPQHKQNNNQNKTEQQEIKQQSQQKQQQKSFTLLSMKNQPIQVKAKQAQSAFNKIYKNQNKKSKIDIKLVEMLDEKLIKLLNCSAFDQLSPKKKRLSQEKMSPLVQNQNNDLGRLTKNMNLKILSKEISIISPQILSSILDVKQTEINDVDDHDVHETSEGLKLYEYRPKQLIQSAETRNRILSFQQSDFNHFDISQNQDEIKQQEQILDPISEKYIQELFQV